MSKYIRNNKGQFKARIKTAYDAGYDSVKSGADTENCHFAWFTNPESTKEWERGRDAALESQKEKTNE